MFNSWFIALRAYGFGNKRVIPSLDGLRALSIALVCIGHLAGTRGFPIRVIPRVDLGAFGVRVFLVISGFLITSILLGEMDRTGTIALRRFYLRRSIRLFPAAYMVIVATAVLALARLTMLNRWDLVFASTYTMNYYNGRGWPLGHLWSLAVEEQFYLLWPLALRTLGAQRGTSLLIALLWTAPLCRLASPYTGSAFNFLVWSDALATGCLLALLRDQLAADARYSRLLASRRFFLVPVAALLANLIPSTKLSWLFGETIMNLCIAISIDWAIRNAKNTATGRFLNLPAVSLLGVLSYSLYLCQQFFLNRNSRQIWCVFPLNIALALAAGIASYLLIEAPCLRLRKD